MEYTKGEWTILNQHGGLAIHTPRGGDGISTGIAKMLYGVGENETKANANLIASAPDLYEACRACLRGEKDWIDAMMLAVKEAEGVNK